MSETNNSEVRFFLNKSKYNSERDGKIKQETFQI